MTTSIVERLRSYLPLGDGQYWSPASKAYAEAANLIEQQAAEIAELKAKLGASIEFDKIQVSLAGQSEKENSELKALAKKMADALKLVEWDEYEDPDWGTQEFCPCCRMKKKHGHYECRTEEALSAYRELIKEQ